MSTNRYLMVSDLHIADVEDHPDGWKRHKGSAWVFDADLGAMLQAFVDRADEGDTLTFLLNGDIFDFDLVTVVPEDPPWPLNSLERLYGLDATEPKSVWKLERMLADHPVFLESLAAFCAAGHKVVLIYGNHDRECWFPAVQEAFKDAIIAAGERLGLAVARDRILCEAWFYYVPNDVYVEHGHQYDFYSAFRYNLEPLVRKKDGIHLALPMGNLSNRYLLSNIGTFNPHATDFILSGIGYIKHWLRYYAFTRRSIIITWLVGSIRALFALLRTRRALHRHPPRDYERHLRDAAERYELPLETVKSLDSLKMEPITSRFFKIVREFWIDRVILAALMTGATITLALTPIPLWVKLMVPLTAFPLVWFLYQWLAGTDNAQTVELASHKYAHAIASRLPVRAVVFGHSHIPNAVPLARGVMFANTGTWAPTFSRKDPSKLAQGLRNYVIVDADADRCHVEVGSWMPLAPDPAASQSLSQRYSPH
ncbi:MAG: metallophosphoesterase [Myxococcales bacterium]|nr:metallophosphoesterase [Myxococcales bacterium]